jgi:hypothetical protein
MIFGRCSRSCRVDCAETSDGQQEQLRLQPLRSRRWACARLLRSSQALRRQRGHARSLQRSDDQAGRETPRDPHGAHPFSPLEDVGDAVPKLLELRPSALEVMDANTLNLIGGRSTASRRCGCHSFGGTGRRRDRERSPGTGRAHDRHFPPVSPHVRSRDRLRS